MLKRLLAPLASLRLAVVLMAMSMLLIYAGTWAQLDDGIWTVQKKYFHSFFVWLDFQTFFPRPAPGQWRIPGGFPMLGGYTLGLLLLVNLLSAHFVRFKFSLKRIGIILTHLGLVLLLVGEGITSGAAVESQMTIEPGGAANYSQDIRSVELAIVDTSKADYDETAVVPASHLRPGTLIKNSKLPVDVQVEAYYPNSGILGPEQARQRGLKNIATKGTGNTLVAIKQPQSDGVGENSIDSASAYVTLSAGKESLGTYLVSLGLNAQEIQVNGKPYQLLLRFKRLYKPYTIHLLKFSHDTYTGTEMARNFASRIRLVDPTRGEDREVAISMNDPLRYHSETFYQQSFIEDKINHGPDLATVLQIVRNPAWLMPYIACAVGALGMIIHFGMHLFGFLRKSASSTSLAASAASKKLPRHKGDAYVLEPQRAWTKATFIVPAIIAGFCIIHLMSAIRTADDGSADPYDPFARLPISYEGRIQPLDSVARNSLKIIGSRETFPIESDRSPLMLQMFGPERRPGIQWLASVIAHGKSAPDAKVFRIDYTELLGMLELDPKRKFFSFNEIMAHGDKIQSQLDRIRDLKIDEKHQTIFERQIVQLYQKLTIFIRFNHELGGLYLVPPLEPGQQWIPLGQLAHAADQTGQTNPAVESIKSILRTFDEDHLEDFRRESAAYHAMLAQKLPEQTARVDFEVFYNRFDPFTQCMVLYIMVFVLASCSWLVWRPVLARSAFWVLMVAIVLHTAGLIGRIYISGRPPVTNLASSAIFIAWGAVGLSAILEKLFKNGMGSAAAAIMGFISLFIYDRLALSGDTMAVLVAVLDTNFWLATHVVVVTLGYASTFLAGLLGIFYVLRGLFTTSLDRDEAKNLSRMIYGIVCFATLFSFVGTILGGIWADQSWGRFWGWDPKENGAVLIVLWNALVLHARWSGLARQRGIAILAIGGNIITSWSWFGTNMLPVGLHSYGRMDEALKWLLVFVASQLLLIAIGNIPLNRWRSPIQA